MNDMERVEVAIVGAGPVGLTAACVLRAAGIEVVVLDAAVEGAHTSRAAVVHARTLEVLESIEVTERLRDAGVVVPRFTVRDRARVLARLSFDGLPTAYPYTLMVPQSTTEAILHGRLTELGGEVRRHARVVGIDVDDGGATLTVATAEAETHLLRADWVIAADGVGSTVRQALGIAYEGGAYEESFVLADVELTWPLGDDEVQLFFSPRGLVVVAPLPGGRHRIVATVADAPPAPTKDDIQALLDERGPGGAVVGDVAWSSRFRLQHRLASSYRRGRVFLAGDAAHAHSPAGGQGMNIGIQDAVDLGETIRDAIRGATDEAHLDGYELRRRPVAQGVVGLTDRMTRAAVLRNPVARAARNLLIRLVASNPAVRRRIAFQLAELAPAPTSVTASDERPVGRSHPPR